MSLPLRLRHAFLLLPFFAAGSSLLAEMPAVDWPTFRGRDRSGVSNETGLLTEWPAGGPKLLWEKRGVGRGYSSVAIVGGRIYTMGDNLPSEENKDEHILCLDRETGDLIWKTKTGAPWNSGDPAYFGSRSTPTVGGGVVCVVTPHGELVCCEAAEGRELWRKNFKRDFGGNKGDGWGYGESVLIDGDNVICTPGGEKMTMAALNKQTGEVVWKTVRTGDRGAGHASAVISEIGGVKVYVQCTASGPIGVRADDGKLLWEYPIARTTAVIPSPIILGDKVFFTAGYGRGGALLKQVAGAAGEVKIEEVYPLKTALNNRHGGVVVIGDYIYADTDNSGNPFCAEWATGTIKWKKRAGKGTASITATSDRLYMLFADGTMVLAKADPADYVEVSSFKVPGSGERPSWSHPVIFGGKLYIREHDRILCYDIRA